MPKNTIYHRLLAKGYTHDDIVEAAKDRGSSREFTLAYADTPDGVPIIGIKYACDFRAEEEYGVSELQKALGVPVGPDGWEMSNKKRDHVTRFEGLPDGAFGFALSKSAVDPVTPWGGHIQMSSAYDKSWGRVAATGAREFKAVNPDARHTYDMYDEWWEHQAPYSQKMAGLTSFYQWDKLAKMQDVARSLGVEKPARTKALVIEQIKAADKPMQPNVWPGWFHYGDTFVLRADRGIVRDVLEMLYEAASRTGTLAFGGGSQVFGSGLALYDGRDVGIKLNRERKAYARWHAKAKKALEPVKAELRSRGFRWFALDSVREGSDGKPRYWLNGYSGGPGYSGQPFGWYTAEELLAEKFVSDRIEYEKKRA